MVLAALALAVGVQGWLSGPREREILARKEADLAFVRAQAGRWAGEEAFRARRETHGGGAAAELEPIAERTLGAGVARLTPRPAEAAGEGWQRREVTVEIREAPLAEAVLFLAAASEGPGGWRLREIDVRPGAVAGRGGLTAVLEALERKAP